MPLLSDLLKALTAWLHIHPELALLITFLVSFGESLAILGTIIPGSITMTAVGVLAGSGIMRIDLTLLAAILGAVAGDGASYMLGFAFSDRLSDMWPFKRYPKWLNAGKEYFARHGGKSVLIGRFVGPLRSIIPVIAGMMRMNRWQFLLANSLSAIGWALLYVMPGVLIGAASSELSTEGATRLFAIILLILVIAWLTSLGIIKLIVRVNIWLAHRLHFAWYKLKTHPTYIKLFRALTPRHERNHYRTAMLHIMQIVCLILSIILICFAHTVFVSNINYSVYLFLQSLHTPFLDTLFIIISFTSKPLAIYCVIIMTGSYAIYYRDWRLLNYWISLIVTTMIVALLIKITTSIPAPPTSASTLFISPTMAFTFAISLLSFLIFYINKQVLTLFTHIVVVLLAVLLPLMGIAYLYLGDDWLSRVLTAYFFGFSVSMAHWILYRRVNHKLAHKQLFVSLLYVALLGTTIVLYMYSFDTTLKIHNPKQKQYILEENAWWNQTNPLLPLYTTSRTGKRTGLFNFQYVGSIASLKSALLTSGWNLQTTSLFNNLVQRAEGRSIANQLPLITQLHLNKKPVLSMTLYTAQLKKLYVLRVWKSNYSLLHSHEPIWLGSIVAAPFVPHTYLNEKLTKQLFDTILPALKCFKNHIVTFENNDTQTAPRRILLIQKSEYNAMLDFSLSNSCP